MLKYPKDQFENINLGAVLTPIIKLPNDHQPLHILVDVAEDMK